MNVAASREAGGGRSVGETSSHERTVVTSTELDKYRAG